VLFSELHKEGPVLEAALLLLFLATSTRARNGLSGDTMEGGYQTVYPHHQHEPGQGQQYHGQHVLAMDVIASCHGDHQQNKIAVKITLAMFMMGGLGS